ncbi:MAG: hypothetical protein JWN92_2161 [Candidatus Acidoferrum typicum]|nr:hypothetical protein [Candidatus Acidoferrum typicum]
MITANLELEQKSQGRVGTRVSASAGFYKWSTVFWMVLIAFAVRVSLLLLLRTYSFERADDYGVGEINNIAASIVKGLGFSSPFGSEYTGPTSWVAPVYPYIVALVFRCFGIMTHASIIFIFTVQSLFSALTVVPILGIADRTVGRRAGMWAAWTWILFPWFSKWAVTWLWEVSLSALLFSLLFWYALYLPEALNRNFKPGMELFRNSIGFGALWGFALLVNPSLATLLPVSLAWCCYELHLRKKESLNSLRKSPERCHSEARRVPRNPSSISNPERFLTPFGMTTKEIFLQTLKPALTSLLVCVIVISPWLLRNRTVFGHWVFLRSNFGVEFALGNYHASFGRGWGGKHPSGNLKEYTDYKQMGEVAYVQSKQKLAMQFVRDSPVEFLTLSAKRVLYFWDGSAMAYHVALPWYWVPSSYAVISFLLLPAILLAHRRKIHAWQMFFGALLLYPLPYYLTYSQTRYRHVIEPIILLLIAYAAVEAFSKLTSFIRPADASATLSTATKIQPS